MNQITQTGTTTEEAISGALAKLGVDRDQVTINVLTEGRKGFLGFGSKLAEVQVTVQEPSAVEVKEEEVVMAEPAEAPAEEKPAAVQEEIVMEVPESTQDQAIEETTTSQLSHT